MSTEMTKLVSEMKNDQENASHLSLQLVTQRKNTDSTSKSLIKCEELLKSSTDKSEQLSRENITLSGNVRNILQETIVNNKNKTKLKIK